MAVEHEHFEHGADVGVRGRGATPEEAFAGAAEALFSLLCEDTAKVRREIEEAIDSSSRTLEDLLVAYLNELISLADARGLVFGRFENAIEQTPDGCRLRGRAIGEKFDPKRHEATVQPKGATYTALEVAPRDGGWIAQCVVDV
jgi:SHS2 domain-containing protein